MVLYEQRDPEPEMPVVQNCQHRTDTPGEYYQDWPCFAPATHVITLGVGNARTQVYRYERYCADHFMEHMTYEAFARRIA